ncbi:hypothetical protein AMATHDRAFT_170995 [Amanita thiersii Skay4041]|uniref:Peptidase C14 caspase domain-containing protein n=1 Tax=Amanita thiersii Skay4041 TaxID=703135 RepID=A0A2A9NT80_9AGAR|nr:hypothetical protein AMATHDRAFT_170995 [Amanita thiersii Skay4041]
MATRVFAVIIGIDVYKSGSIWNLHSCVDDAKKVRQWLVNDLGVPKSNTRLLLDSEATRANIEDCIMNHLVNNPSIGHGDAIIIYFAGHGSHIPAPPDWFQNDPAGYTDILCTYDHDTRNSTGRAVGICDRSMHALLRQLSETKGDNITLILDCCFSPPRSRANVRDRRNIRWTPTLKATPDDLYRGLWPGARGMPYHRGSGFCELQPKTHTLLAACEQDGKATEGKDGGKFTNAFLDVASNFALHRASYKQFYDYICRMIIEEQHPICLGVSKDRIVFDAVPFTPDGQFVPVGLDDALKLRVEAGAIHGIALGSEFSVHLHNYRGSKNPSIASITITEVHPTWCFGNARNTKGLMPDACWARLSRWNNPGLFRVRLKSTWTSFCRFWKLRRRLPTQLGLGTPTPAGINVIRVTEASQADISLKVGRNDFTVQSHDQIISGESKRTIKIRKKHGLEVIDDAARFHMHLHRENSKRPLQDMVKLELYSLNPLTWYQTDENLLENGKATIHCDQSAIFTAVIRNHSDRDLWPYLVFMDPNCYGITILYHPDPTLPSAPLPKQGSLHVGSGKPGSEALSFALSDRDLESGFLKLFLTTAPVPMNMIEQGPSSEWMHSVEYLEAFSQPSFSMNEIWDTSLACLAFVKEEK